MFPVKKILFPTDFSDSANTALNWALMLAKNFEAELHMLHAVVLHNDDVGDEVFSRFPDMGKCLAMLEENADTKLEKKLPDSGTLNIEKHVVRGINVDEEITNFAEDNSIDLIIMGTKGRTGLPHILLGSVVERTIRKSHKPVLTIRNSKRYTSKTDLSRIIVPIDFSNHCKLALKTAVHFRDLLDATLELVHVIDSTVHPAFYSAGLDSPSKVDSDLVARVEKHMKEFAQDDIGEGEIIFTVAEGNPAREISQLADSHTDAMIVISSHGAGALERFMMGSTTERVVRQAKSPVLTMKCNIEE